MRATVGGRDGGARLRSAVARLHCCSGTTHRQQPPFFLLPPPPSLPFYPPFIISQHCEKERIEQLFLSLLQKQAEKEVPAKNQGDRDGYMKERKGGGEGGRERKEANLLLVPNQTFIPIGRLSDLVLNLPKFLSKKVSLLRYQRPETHSM